jgi:extracellular elastinolytic metalloproteinase
MKTSLRKLFWLIPSLSAQCASSGRAISVIALAIVVALVVPALRLPGVQGQAQITEAHTALPDFDSRVGKSEPTGAQLAQVANLGAQVKWNRFGTPQSLIKYGGFLATGLANDPVVAARDWIRTNRTLFRLSDPGVSNLELVNDSPMVGSQGHAIIFRQRFGNLPATHDAMITVGVTGGKVAYASSSLPGDAAAPGQATLSAVEAWLIAAANVNRSATLVQVSNVIQQFTWTTFTVFGFSHPQRSRLVAFPTYTQGVRPAFETIVLDVQNGNALAYTVFVDAQTGAVLFRRNAVQQLAKYTRRAAPLAPLPKTAFAPVTSVFTGTYQDAPAVQACGPRHSFTVPAGTTSIQVVASQAVITNDIVLKLYYNNGISDALVATADTGTSPEVINYAPGVLPPGTYKVEVCPFASPTAPATPPYNYAGTFTTNDVPTPSFPYPPKWKAFPANPALDLSSTDTRQLWCWDTALGTPPVPIPGCQYQLKNIAARAPWDHNILTNTPSLTTVGNNAITGEAWGSPLTPAEPYRPVSPMREYNFAWTNAWKTSRCNPANLVPGGNDIDAAVANLFAMHNRMHDWSYFLGFTERNFNMQTNNFGNTPPAQENDPEVGNSQAGALSGGSPSYLGRDNANQITLNDGVPGITNMYLWQPIAAAFYAPCVDGDFDMSIIGHEYTHAISNRMVGGPDSGLSGHQAGSMGESWSDLSAVEYLNEYGFVPTGGESPFAVGAYATGNSQTGIRNYNMSANPLNYSDIGYDVGGPEVHSDAEPWDGVNFDIRQALISKYNASYPATDAALQKSCADGQRPADQCPGNRRWIQIMFDAWLLMPAGTSMLDARDAYLAADLMRFGGANQVELWTAFARRGMGVSASSATSDDTDPIPAFDAPVGPVEANVTFDIRDEQGIAIEATVFVGHYEARATPAADTIASTTLGSSLLMMPGTYDFLVKAEGFGLQRLTRNFTAGQNAIITLLLPTNYAAASRGAIAVASSGAASATNAIDGTESTNWAGTGQATADQTLTINLAEDAPLMVKQFNISAMIAPGAGGRFTALRKFRLEASTNGVDFTPIYTSADDAFPGTVPRPTAPNLILRTFKLQTPVMATHIRLIADTNQCQGGPGFQGEQDDDPLNATPCTGNAAADTVRVAEVEVFASGCLCPGLPFTDVPPTHPFYAEICKIRQRGITLGTTATTYSPDDPTTRAQMALFISRALGVYNPVVTPTPTFNDVATNDPVFPFIQELARRGITQGCGGGNFCPNDLITREQMAIFIIRALGVTPPPATGIFADVPANSPSAPYIEEIYRRGITQGCSASPLLYCPASVVTRAQMAAFLVRAFGLDC